MSDLQFLAPILKHEKLPDGRLMIEGVATSEALDRQNEIIDYGSAKEVFKAWGGNIREQHDPKKAVGRAVDVAFDDDGKQVVLKAFISAGAKDTQEKIQDGTLSMFSIGGKSLRKADEAVKTSDGSEVMAKRVFMQHISEVSVVDAGANPDSGFAVVKADGELGDALDGGTQDAAPIEEPAEEPAEDTDKADEPDDIAKAELAAVDELAELMNSGKITAERVLELAKADIDISKRGARNSKADSDRIQAMHDHASALGAKCDPDDDGDDDSKADKTGDIHKLESLEGDIAKLTEERDVLKADLSKAAARIAELEAMPEPMKGRANAVGITKAEDNGTSTVDIDAEAERIAKSANPAMELIKMVHQRPQRLY